MRDIHSVLFQFLSIKDLFHLSQANRKVQVIVYQYVPKSGSQKLNFCVTLNRVRVAFSHIQSNEKESRRFLKIISLYSDEELLKTWIEAERKNHKNSSDSSRSTMRMNLRNGWAVLYFAQIGRWDMISEQLLSQERLGHLKHRTVAKAFVHGIAAQTNIFFPTVCFERVLYRPAICFYLAAWGKEDMLREYLEILRERVVDLHFEGLIHSALNGAYCGAHMSLIQNLKSMITESDYKEHVPTFAAWAIRKGHRELFDSLLPLINISYTMLMHGAISCDFSNQRAAMFDLVLQNCSPALLDWDPLLGVACGVGDLDLVKRCLQYTQHISVETCAEACSGGNVEVVKLLMSTRRRIPISFWRQGALVAAKKGDKDIILHLAQTHGDFKGIMLATLEDYGHRELFEECSKEIRRTKKRYTRMCILWWCVTCSCIIIIYTASLLVIRMEME